MLAPPDAATIDAALAIGFGRLGLRSGIRTFAELIAESAYDKRPLVEVRPKAVVTGWSLVSGATYQAPYFRAFYNYGDTDSRNDILRDVVAVQTSLDAGLTRVETVAACTATAGTFYYDYSAAISTARFDDGVSKWDDGVLTWDVVPKLFVHLEDGSNPSATTVVAALGFYFSTLGATHPHLGEPLYSLASSAVSFGVVAQPTVAGAYYRLSGAYRSATPSTISVVDGSNGSLVTENGRDLTNSVSKLFLADTTGDDTRRFTFDFIAPSTLVSLFGTSDLFTDVSLRRIYRFNFYEPRLASGAAPTASQGLNDTLFGGSKIGVGQTSLINADASLEADFGELIWVNAEVRSYFGGVFRDGTPLDLSDYQRSFSGAVQDVEATDKGFALSMQDLKTFYTTLLPANTYNRAQFGSILLALDGKPRPLLFGAVTNITPGRIDKLGDYGKYEFADGSDAPNGFKAIDNIYSFTDTTAANDADLTKRLTLVSGVDFTPDLTNGQFTIIRDVQPYIVDATNNKVNFDIGAAELTATVPIANYSATSLAAALTTALIAAGGGASALCLYTDSTHKFAIGASAGTLNLRTQSGTNKDISLYKLIGFHTDANKTGALSYIGDDVTFTDADKDHVLRIDAQGYKDDANGTYTGTPNALIQTGPDVTRYVLRRLLKKPLNIIDTTSFANARTTAPQQLGIYLNTSQITTRALFDGLEYSTLSTITVDGAGSVFYDVYAPSPSVAVALTDADYIAFSLKKLSTDIFQQVVVEYATDPSKDTSRDKILTVSSTDSSTGVKYGRIDTKTIATYLLSRADAAYVASVARSLFAGNARRATISVKGKLLRLRLGQAVSLTRARGMYPVLKATSFRVMSLQHSFSDALTSAELLEVV